MANILAVVMRVHHNGLVEYHIAPRVRWIHGIRVDRIIVGNVRLGAIRRQKSLPEIPTLVVIVASAILHLGEKERVSE